MSQYLTPTFTPTSADPTPFLLESLVNRFQNGVPEYGLASASWPNAANPSPTGHFCLPTGTRLYCSDDPADAKINSLVIHSKGDTKLEGENHKPGDPQYWTVPVLIRLLLIRQTTSAETAILLRFLKEFIASGFKIDGEIHEARHYFTTTKIHVFGVRDPKSEPINQNDGWSTALEASATFFCASKL